MGVRGGSGELSRSPCTSRRLSAGSRPSGNAMTAGRAAPARRGNPHCLSHVRQSHAQRKMRFPRAEKAFSTRKIKHFFYFSGHTLLIICILRLKRGFTCGGSPLILALCVCSDGVPAQAGTGLRRPTGLRPLLIYIRTRVRAKPDTGGTGGRETGEREALSSRLGAQGLRATPADWGRQPCRQAAYCPRAWGASPCPASPRSASCSRCS